MSHYCKPLTSVCTLLSFVFCSVCSSWCLYFPLPRLHLLVVLTVFTSTSKACNPGEATEKTTGSPSRSCSSDHRGECEVFGQCYGWARWADWAPRGNTESGVWCASWCVAARHWHTRTSPTTVRLYLDSGFFRRTGTFISKVRRNVEGLN